MSDPEVQRALKRRVRRDREAGIALPIEIARQCEEYGVATEAPKPEPVKAPAKKATKKKAAAEKG